MFLGQEGFVVTDGIGMHDFVWDGPVMTVVLLSSCWLLTMILQWLFFSCLDVFSGLEQ